uniref:hypothetical protein n=1 Tax=Enterocloster clostridioformis TaxID=1531 RepID=UPI001C3E4B50
MHSLQGKSPDPNAACGRYLFGKTADRFWTSGCASDAAASIHGAWETSSTNNQHWVYIGTLLAITNSDYNYGLLVIRIGDILQVQQISKL